MEHLPQAQILVVDNGSSDGTKEYLNTQQATLISLNENKGVAAARNIGIQQATKEYIILLDDDAFIQNIDIQNIQEYFEKNPKTAVLAPLILYPNLKTQESIRSFPTIPSLLWRGLGLYKLFPNVPWYTKYIQNDAKSIHPIDWAIGACLIIPKNMFNTLGNFDEKYFFGYEDTDFCYTAKQKGYTNIFWPTTTIIHDYARTSASPLSASFYKHLYSMCRFLWKHKV